MRKGGVRHFLRMDTIFDIVQHTYIHGGSSLKREGTSVAPPTRRTAHRTRTHAGPSHAPRHAEHAALLFCAGVLVELEREPDEGFPASPAWSPSIGAEATVHEIEVDTEH